MTQIKLPRGSLVYRWRDKWIAAYNSAGCLVYQGKAPDDLDEQKKIHIVDAPPSVEHMRKDQATWIM